MDALQVFEFRSIFSPTGATSFVGTLEIFRSRTDVRSLSISGSALLLITSALHE